MLKETITILLSGIRGRIYATVFPGSLNELLGGAKRMP